MQLNIIKYSIYFLLHLFAQFSFAQELDTNNLQVHVEQMPSFVGGEKALINFIETNLTYPEQEKKDKIQGKVFCSFIVDANGKVTSPKILRSIANHPSFDNEVLLLLSKMPIWNAGKQNGKPVSVQFSLPINFSLPK